MKEQSIFYVTDDNLKHYSKNVSTPYENDTVCDIVKALKDRIQFIKTSDQSVIYRDKNFTFHLPQKLRPFEVFPQLKYGIAQSIHELEDSLTEKLDQKCSLSIVDHRSYLYERITIKFVHIRNSVKPIFAEIPFAPKGDNLLTSIKEILGDETWEMQEQYLASAINAPIENIVFRFSNEGDDTILFTFSKIYDVLKQFFKDDGNLFQPFGCFNYDLSYIPQIPRNMKSLINMNEDENILNKFSNSLRNSLEFAKPSQYIQVIVREMRAFLDLNILPLDKDAIENLKKVICSILPFVLMNFFSSYFSVFQNYRYNKWDEIYNIPKEINLRESSFNQPPDFELLSAICISKWRSFINDIVDLFHFTLIKFRTKMNPQKNIFFGTIVYSHYVKLQEQQYTLILSRAFVHLYNFAPKSETYEILPETYGFYCGNKTPLIFGSPIQCVKFTQFQPESQIGVLSTTQGHFMIDFGSVKALTDFWLMLSFCQNDVEQPYIKPAIPDLNIKISFPFIAPRGKYFNADIKAGNDKWSKLVPLDRCVKNIENIYSRLKKFQTRIPLSSIPKLKEWMISENSFDFMHRNYSLSFIGNSIDVTNEYDNDKIQLIILYATCFELLCSPIKSDQFKFFSYLGISDFNKSITDHSLSLLQYQLKNFNSFLSSYKVQNAPLLHFASMFCDNLDFLQMIIDNVNVNGKDDDKRTAFFYSIRSPKLTATQMLFENDGNPDIGDNLSETPMTLSIRDESIDKTLFLASNGASVNKTNMNLHQSALYFSIENGNIDLFEKLLPYCPSYTLNYPTAKGSFLTHLLIKHKLSNQLLLLSQRCPEFDPNLYSKNYPHPIHYFFDNYGKSDDFNFELFNALLSLQNLDLNIRNDKDQTPLSRCIHIKDLSILQRLIYDPRCNLELQDENQQTCLYVAIANNYKDAVSLLLKAGALANTPNHDKEKNTPIMLAVKNNDISTIELLINYGANPNKWYNTEGLLPQHIGSNDVIQRLKEKGFSDVYQPRS